MEQQRNTDAYTVKEMLSLVVIPALEELKENAKERQRETDERLTRLESWRNKGVGAFALLTAIVIPLTVPVIITVLNGAHH